MWTPSPWSYGAASTSYGLYRKKKNFEVLELCRTKLDDIEMETLPVHNLDTRRRFRRQYKIDGNVLSDIEFVRSLLHEAGIENNFRGTVDDSSAARESDKNSATEYASIGLGERPPNGFMNMAELSFVSTCTCLQCLFNSGFGSALKATHLTDCSNSRVFPASNDDEAREFTCTGLKLRELFCLHRSMTVDSGAYPEWFADRLGLFPFQRSLIGVCVCRCFEWLQGLLGSPTATTSCCDEMIAVTLDYFRV